MRKGYFKFNTDEQREQKLNLFEAIELDNIYATNGDTTRTAILKERWRMRDFRQICREKNQLRLSS